MMVRRLFAVSLIALVPVALTAQTAPTPRPAAPAPPTPRPAAPAPPAPRPAARAAVTTLAFQLTDPLGVPLSKVQVTTQGPVVREGLTDEDGSVKFTNMRAGTYRVRFAREDSITLEREATLRNGESLTIDVALNAAPIPPKAPDPVPVPEPVKGLPPPGDPKVTPVPLFLEKNFVGREARKESVLGCTPTGTATLFQLREAWLNHTHDDADEWLYVVAGEGVLRIGTSDQKVVAGTFSLIPHTVSHAVLPQGKNPIIVISILSGPPCASAR